VGSVIDTLFLTSAVGGAIFAALCAAMTQEPVRVVGHASPDDAARRRPSTPEPDDPNDAPNDAPNDEEDDA
jgi:hypothetical protein